MQLNARTLFFVVLLMALPVAAYFFMFVPRNDAMRQAQEDTRQKREKLTELDKLSQEKKDLQAESDKYRKAITFFEHKLPEKKETEKVHQEVWQIAEKNGMNVTSVRLQKVVEGASYNEQPIQMRIVGRGESFCKFLQSVEMMERIVHIGEMTIEGDEKDNGVVKVNLTLTIFFERSEDQPST